MNLIPLALALALVPRPAQGGQAESVSLRLCGFDELLGVSWEEGAPRVGRLDPAGVPGMPGGLAGSFGTTDECKALADGRLLVASSGGAVAVIERGRVGFAAAVPNAHSIELLPGGRVASAASVNARGNRLLVHDLASGALVQEFPLESAHGVVHDRRRRALYALGRGELVVFGCDPRTGVLTERARFPLPDGPRAGGHDLRAVPRSAELIVTTEGRVWLFDRDFETFRPHPTLGALARVKSVDVHPSTGRVAFVQADEGEWWSETVGFANPPGLLRIEGERFYKARWDPAGDRSGPPRLDSAALAATPDGAGGDHTRLLFGSCADEDAITAATWRRAAALAPDGFVLLGDTPYIDSTDPAVQARRYGEFAAFTPFSDVVRTTPVMGSVWDDHDFGRNDVDGELPGKGNSRAAFVAARSAPPFRPPYGADGEGIYSRFRRGPVEVFLLDTRWFARTASSEFDADEPTLLGEAQWAWLRKGLRASDAPLKVLACGMIWNGAVRPFKTDHWGAYPAEFGGLCRFLGQEGITGVVLVGGDIHRPRAVVHDVADTVGYPLLELISSPMHGRIIGLANAPHPGLLFDSGEGQVVLELSCDGGSLRATFHRPDEVLFELRRDLADLRGGPR